MTKNQILLTVTVLALTNMTLEADAVTTATNLYRFTKNGNVLGLPYLSNKPLLQQNFAVTRLLVSIHSSSYDAFMYLTNGMVSAAMVPGAAEETLMIAPHFLQKQWITDPIAADMLYWDNEPVFWGTQLAFCGPTQQEVRISTYEALDTMLTQIVTNSWYPNLRNIVIAGHSAGGQFVTRYAAGNRFENKYLPPGIHVRYVVMAPSSYVYFDTLRVVPGTDNVFQPPNTNSAAFNKYGYGLENLYAYLTSTTANGMRTNYLNRFVFYLVGSLDHFQDDSLDTGYAAMLQGSNRYEHRRKPDDIVMECRKGTTLRRATVTASQIGLQHALVDEQRKWCDLLFRKQCQCDFRVLQAVRTAGLKDISGHLAVC